MNEEKHDARLQKFSSNREDFFQLWALQVESALDRREIDSALAEEPVERQVDETTFPIIVTTLSSSSPFAVQKCTTDSSARKRLQIHCAGTAMINKMGVLNIFFNTQQARTTGTG